MTMLYSNLCNSKVCYEGTALYNISCDIVLEILITSRPHDKSG